MKKQEKVAKDPVCGKRITPETAYAVVRHQGRDYLMCCPLCQSAFEKDPEMFAYLDELEQLRSDGS